MPLEADSFVHLTESFFNLTKLAQLTSVLVECCLPQGHLSEFRFEPLTEGDSDRLLWCPTQMDLPHITVTGQSQNQTQVQPLISEKSVFESQGLMEKGRCFIQEVPTWADGRPAFQNHLPGVSQRTKGSKGSSRWRPTCGTAQAAPKIILKWVMRWSDQHHLGWITFKQLIFGSRVGVVPFH